LSPREEDRYPADGVLAATLKNNPSVHDLAHLARSCHVTLKQALFYIFRKISRLIVCGCSDAIA
jgi:hypothetical protein